MNKPFLIFLALTISYSAHAQSLAGVASAISTAAENTAAAANATVTAANATLTALNSTLQNATTAVNNSQVVPVSDLQTNQLLNELFNWGFNESIANSIRDGTIPNATYTVQNVTNITETPLSGGELYTFQATASSAAGAANTTAITTTSTAADTTVVTTTNSTTPAADIPVVPAANGTVVNATNSTVSLDFAVTLLLNNYTATVA